VCSCAPASQSDGVSEYGYEVVYAYPHDPNALTQGLVYLNGFLYEGTGLPGGSSIRKVKLETGEILQKRDIPGRYFGEGIINWKDRLLDSYLINRKQEYFNIFKRPRGVE
jgi:glutaminyl-peptide cyclotransferase